MECVPEALLPLMIGRCACSVAAPRWCIQQMEMGSAEPLAVCVNWVQVDGGGAGRQVAVS